MSVFDGLVGQEKVVAALRDASAVGATGTGMTHAWLFTGPPGSGRSVAARAFAAALQCPRGGCGECHECHTAMSGAHPDVVKTIEQYLRTARTDSERFTNATGYLGDAVSDADVHHEPGTLQRIVAHCAKQRERAIVRTTARQGICEQ